MSFTPAAESDSSVSQRLTPDQQALAQDHLCMVGMHLKKRVPTSRRPNRDRDYDDLFQEGCLGLLRAAARYRAGRDGIFAAFALPRIRGNVHAALHEYFGTIRVPLSAQRAHRAKGQPARSLAEDLPERTPDTARLPNTSGAGESIRHLLRHRYEYAVRLAVRTLQAGPYATPQRNAALALIAQHRLLINDEDARTTLRNIAARSGVSSGRACEYEQKLSRVMQEILAADTRTRMLIEWAGESPRGFDTIIDEAQQQRLDDADLLAFERRFAGMNSRDRGEILCALIEATTVPVEEVARNLYRLAGEIALLPAG